MDKYITNIKLEPAWEDNPWNVINSLFLVNGPYMIKYDDYGTIFCLH